MAPRRPMLAVAMVAVALVLGVVGRPSDALGQSGPSSFTLTAGASGVTMAVVTPNLSVVDTLVEVGGSVAQTEVNSLGLSRAFAANPTPGELVLTSPGLLAGLSGLPVPNEQFPTTAQSSHPSQPEQTSGTPPATIEARSQATRSEARAVTGQSEGGSIRSTAFAEVDESGMSRAESTVLAGPITVGPVVISNVRSLARAEVGADGQAEVATDFEVGVVVVEGQAATITPDGLQLAGTEVPIAGADTPEDLASQGLQVRTLDANEDPESGTATSPSVEITIRQTLEQGIPGLVPPGQEVIVRYVVGRATVGAAAVTPSAPPQRVPDPSLPPTSPDPAPTVGQTSTSAPQSPPSASVEIPEATRAPSTSPPAVDDPQVADVADAPASAAPGVASARLVASPIDSFLFYPVLVVAAIAALGSVQAMRTSGRRRLWDEMTRDFT